MKGRGFVANYREILRLNSLCESIRFIARSTGSSLGTVAVVLNAAKKAYWVKCEETGEVELW